MDAASGGESGGEKDEGEEDGGGDSERDANEEELLGPDCPVLVGPSDGVGLLINPRLKFSPAGHEYLRQWGIAVADGGGKIVYKGEDDGGGEDLTSESDAAGLSTQTELKSTTTRKTCDEGDSQDTNHTSKSGRDEE